MTIYGSTNQNYIFTSEHKRFNKQVEYPKRSYTLKYIA